MKYNNLPFNEYLELADTISTSEMKVLLESPLKYKHQYIDGKREDKEAFRVGRFLHTAVLEPDKLMERYIVAPEINRRTNAGKAEWAAFLEKNKDKEIVTPADCADMDHMIEALKGHVCEPFPGKQIPLLSLFSGCEFEVSYVGELDGHMVRVRPDAINHEMKYILDLKFVRDASPSGFSKACANFGYGLQAANYLDIVNQVEKCQEYNGYRFLFLAIEKSAPYDYGLYELDEHDVDAVGREMRGQALHLKTLCETRPEVFKRSYTKGIMKLSLPGWVYYQQKEE